jgi:hypothetical protein
LLRLLRRACGSTGGNDDEEGNADDGAERPGCDPSFSSSLSAPLERVETVVEMSREPADAVGAVRLDDVVPCLSHLSRTATIGQLNGGERLVERSRCLPVVVVKRRMSGRVTRLGRGFAPPRRSDPRL